MNSDLNALRHSAAHLLAASVLELYPDTKLTIGPAIENGFYYDFDFSANKKVSSEANFSISDDDLAKIEKKMHEILKSWHSFSHREVDEKQARELLKNNPYKLEILDEIVKKGEPITFYKAGNFEDLCRGEHVAHPKEEIGAFKLLSIAGAYWRGDEKNPMLTRIYGTAFRTKDELEKYLLMLEEAKKRDHKKLGRELDLFIFSDLVGPGLPLWTPKGTLIRNLLDEYVWKLREERGYQKVTIPHITKKELYETSGHWSKFEQELFKITSREGHLFAMKPMNCPHHTQIFSHIPRSYRDIPQRYTETTMCYRDEQTGELSGLSRVRSFTQDDAHVFARISQIKHEFSQIWDIVDTFYSTFGFTLKVRLSLHDPNNMHAYLGSSQRWTMAEDALRQIARERIADVFEAPGEAAFYGPKIDFMATDSLGRSWQVATIQLDMNMPERFDLYCINEKGERERIVMIHAAIMGSIERFVSILIEHYAGAFPTWLAPIQVAVLPITDKVYDYADKIASELTQNGIRVFFDRENDTLGAKIRRATLQKIPYICIIGDKENNLAATKGIKVFSLRKRNGEDLGQVELPVFLRAIKEEIETRT